VIFDDLNESRQTGRTTRMLEKALAAAREGATVLVIGASPVAMISMKDIARRLAGDDKEALMRLTFECARRVEEGSMRGRRFTHAIEDHYSAEERSRR
jgi:hypothetical protein